MHADKFSFSHRTKKGIFSADDDDNNNGVLWDYLQGVLSAQLLLGGNLSPSFEYAVKFIRIFSAKIAEKQE